MKMSLIVLVLFLSAGNAPGQTASQSDQVGAGTFQCLPCGQECDKPVYGAAGTCDHCHMDLVKTSSIKFSNISPEKVCSYVKSHPNTILLDVRTAEEFGGRGEPNFGTLRNAINVPIQELEQSLRKISHLKDREIIVYCSHSHRSPRVSYLLTQNGFKKVINMEGGMSVMPNDNCVKK
jgi:rhodanese-related sulfurtransferase